MQIHQQHLDLMVRREGRPTCEGVADFDAEETSCPACSSRFRTAGTKRCPSCGLRFA